MAITSDSGVRNTAPRDLSSLTEEDRELVASREQAVTKGLRGMDVPVNSDNHDEPHVAPLWIMYGTFAALILLTAATVAARQVDLSFIDSSANIVVALGLAFIKSVLVAMFFMHLFWDSKFNQLVLISTLFFLTVFIGFAIIDSNEYQPIVNPMAADAYAGEPPA